MSSTPTYASREDQARAEIGETEVSLPLAKAIVMIFLVLIFSVPVIQLGLSTCKDGESAVTFITAFDGAAADMQKAAGEKEGFIGSVLAANDVLNKRIKESETSLDDNLFLSQLMLSDVQAFMCRLGVGNEKAFVGEDGWWFYEPGVVSITGPGFLEPDQLKVRSKTGVQPDPVLAIMDTRDQLKAMGIELIVMPVPVKPSIHPGQFANTGDQYGSEGIRNRSWALFANRLAEAEIMLFDSQELLCAMDTDVPHAYLKTDTHWTPQAMQWVAAELGEMLRYDNPSVEAPDPIYKRTPQEVSNLGDIGVMLKLPEGQTLFPQETVTIQQVERVDGKPLSEEQGAEVLLLGDSFSNIFSLEDMGWGSSAGFAEQLRVELNQPVRSIVRNDEGARATRKMLSTSLKRGEPLLAGIKVVVWQFAARELALGNWTLIELPHVDAPESSTPEPAQPSADGVRVTGEILAVSGRPEKGAVYKNFIMKLHVGDMKLADGSDFEDGEGVVHVLAMKDKVILPSAKLKAGDKSTFIIKPWDDVRRRYETMKAGVLDDEEVELLSELYWGELP